jgi:energy-coupling factor transporter ATP-binding protein EcfA2
LRIHSVTVQNYRVHRALTVHFDERLTVIGGPNEAGKSTLVEAVHRALFMRHKGGGEHLDDMRSHHGGHPEVEVTFEASGRRCVVRKRFRGQSGTAVLEEEGQPPRHGDDAEQRLAELLGESEAARRWSRERWSHLWVWQQNSFEDPSDGTNDRADDLVNRFQQNGAAVVQLSSRDAKLADDFATRVSERFNKNGTPKRGSPLDLALEDHKAAQLAVTERTAALDKLYDAARRLDSARTTLREVAGSLADRERELHDALARQQQLSALRSRAELEERDAGQRREAWETLLAREDTIRALRAQVALLTERIAPMQREATLLAQDEQAALAAFDDAVRQLSETDGIVRMASARSSLADTYESRLDLQRQQQELDERAARVRDASTEATRLRVELASLLNVDAETCQAIDTAVRDVELAEAKLAAIATRVELLRADVAVQLGNDVLNVGSPQIITNDTELSVGEAVRLRITPGGGASVADAERALTESRRTLAERLSQAGVGSAADARALLERRVALSTELAMHERRLEDLVPASIEEQQRTLSERIAEVAARFTRLSEQGVTLAEPVTIAAAQALSATMRAELQAAEERQLLLLAARNSAYPRVDDARTATTAHTDSMGEQQRELERHQQALGAQLSVHGSDMDRAKALAAAEAAYQHAAVVVSATGSEMTALDPDGVDETVRMLSVAVETLRDRRTAAKQEEFVAQRDLQQDGSRDPHAELSVAEARERDVAERVARVRLQAEAVRELQALYSREQQQLAEQFAQPMRARADKYLRVVLPDSGMHVEYDNSKFGGLAIVRGASRTQYRFDSLSTGAREQVATALRLGVAEVLAEGHGGTLPVVFDDAFAYSDPERLARLRRMLFRAAESGLQVIVLSCNAADYDGLGTRITIERSAEAVMAAPIETESDATAADDDAPHEVHRVSTSGVATESDAEAFLTALTRLGGRSGNQSLRQELDWDEIRYEVTRSRLLAKGTIVLGKGRGGSVLLVE